MLAAVHEKALSMTGRAINSPLLMALFRGQGDAPADEPLALKDQSAAAAVEEKRKRIVSELVATEGSYNKGLTIAVDVYAPALDEALNDEQRKLMFGNLVALRDLSSKLIDAFGMSVPGAFIKHARFLKIFNEFCDLHPARLALLSKIQAENTLFQEIMGRGIPGATQSLQSCLIMPIQRVPRYVLLLEELCKTYNETNESFERNLCVEALEKVREACSGINESLRRRETAEKLSEIELRNKLGLFEGNTQRVFVREDALVVQASLPFVFIPSRLVMFSDLILLASSVPLLNSRASQGGVILIKSIERIDILSPVSIRLVTGGKKDPILRFKEVDIIHRWIDDLKQKVPFAKDVVVNDSAAKQGDIQGDKTFALAEVPKSEVASVSSAGTSETLPSTPLRVKKCQSCFRSPAKSAKRRRRLSSVTRRHRLLSLLLNGHGHETDDDDSTALRRCSLGCGRFLCEECCDHDTNLEDGQWRCFACSSLRNALEAKAREEEEALKNALNQVESNLIRKARIMLVVALAILCFAILASHFKLFRMLQRQQEMAVPANNFFISVYNGEEDLEMTKLRIKLWTEQIMDNVGHPSKHQEQHQSGFFSFLGSSATTREEPSSIGWRVFSSLAPAPEPEVDDSYLSTVARLAGHLLDW